MAENHQEAVRAAEPTLQPEPTRQPEAAKESLLTQDLAAALKPLDALKQQILAKTGLSVEAEASIHGIRVLVGEFPDEDDQAHWHSRIDQTQALVEAEAAVLLAKYGDSYIAGAMANTQLPGLIIDRMVAGGMEVGFSEVVKTQLVDSAWFLMWAEMHSLFGNLSDKFNYRAHMASLPTFEAAAKDLEEQASTILQDSIVPAIAGVNKARLLAHVGSAAFAAPFNFLAISSLFNERLQSSGFDVSFLIFLLANLGSYAIPQVILHAEEGKLNKSLADGNVSNRRGVSDLAVLPNDQYGVDRHGQRLLDLAGRAPREFLDAIEKVAGGTVNYLRLTTLVYVLSFISPYPIDKLITEPRNASVQNEITDNAGRAAKEFASRLSGVSADQVRQELGKSKSSSLDLATKQAEMSAEFIVPGEDCDPEFGFGSYQPSASAQYSPTLKAWISKVGRDYEIFVPSSSDWSLSDAEGSECFGEEEPQFGGRIVVRQHGEKWVVDSVEHAALRDEGQTLTVTPVRYGDFQPSSFKGGELEQIGKFVADLNAASNAASEPKEEVKKAKKKTGKKKRR